MKTLSVQNYALQRSSIVYFILSISQLKFQNSYLRDSLLNEKMNFLNLSSVNDGLYPLILQQQLKICTKKFHFNFCQIQKFFPEFFDSKFKYKDGLSIFNKSSKKKKYFKSFDLNLFYRKQHLMNPNLKKGYLKKKRLNFQTPYYLAHLYALFLQESIFFHQLFYFQTKFSFFENQFSKNFFSLGKSTSIFPFPTGNSFSSVFQVPLRLDENKTLLKVQPLFFEQNPSDVHEQHEIFKSWSLQHLIFSFVFNQKKNPIFFCFSKSIKLFLKKIGYWKKRKNKISHSVQGFVLETLQIFLKSFQANKKSESFGKTSFPCFIWTTLCSISSKENLLETFFFFFKLKSIVSKLIWILFLNPKFEAKNSQLNFQANFQYSIHQCIFSLYRQFSCSQSNFSSRENLKDKEISPKFIWKFDCSPFFSIHENFQKRSKAFSREQNSLNFSKFFFLLLFDKSMTNLKFSQKHLVKNLQNVKLNSLFSICKDSKFVENFKQKNDPFFQFSSISSKEKSETTKTFYFQTCQGIEENIFKTGIQTLFHRFEKDTFFYFLDQNFAKFENYKFHSLKNLFLKFFKKKIYKHIQIFEPVAIGFDFSVFQKTDSFASLYRPKVNSMKTSHFQYGFVKPKKTKKKFVFLSTSYFQKNFQEKKEKTGFVFSTLKKDPKKNDFKTLFQTFFKNQIFQYNFHFFFLTENQFIFQKFSTFFHQWFFEKVHCIYFIQKENRDFLWTEETLLYQKMLQNVRFSHSYFSFMGEKPGFDFLGFSFRHYSVPYFRTQNSPSSSFILKKTGSDFQISTVVLNKKNSRNMEKKLNNAHFSNFEKKTELLKPSLFPTKFQTLQYLAVLKQILKQNKAQSQEFLIQQLTPLILNWCFYFRISSNQKIFSFCDFMLFKWVWKWCCRRHSKKSQNWIRKKYFLPFKDVSSLFSSDVEKEEDFQKLLQIFSPLSFTVQLSSRQGREQQWISREKQNHRYFFCCFSKSSSFSSPNQSVKKNLNSIQFDQNLKTSYSCLPFHTFTRKAFLQTNSLCPNLEISQYAYYDSNWDLYLVD